MQKGLLIGCIFLCILTTVHAQEKVAGPVIEEFGKVWQVPDVDVAVATGKTYKAVFDVMRSPDDPTTVNPGIETVARFLNMHAQNGVPPNRLKAILVVHNQASKDLVNNTAYEARFQVQNPNQPLLKALMQAGVSVYFCGQSAYSRNFKKVELVQGVQFALSAMTVLIDAQDAGYRLIKF